VDDVADLVTIAEGEEGVSVGDVERFHGDPADEEGRHLGPAVRGDDDLVSEVDQRAGVCAPIMPSPPVTRIIGPPRSGGG